MNLKITLPELTGLLSAQTGASKKTCDEFLKEFFASVAGNLENGENVKIKGFGTFKVTRVDSRKSVNITTGLEYEIPAHNRVSFVASKELANAVNAPFEAFEAVILADDVTEEMLDRHVADDYSETTATETSVTEEASAEIIEPTKSNTEPEETDISVSAKESETIPAAIHEVTESEDNTEYDLTEPEVNSDEYEISETPIEPAVENPSDNSLTQSGFEKSIDEKTIQDETVITEHISEKQPAEVCHPIEKSDSSNEEQSPIESEKKSEASNKSEAADKETIEFNKETIAPQKESSTNLPAKTSDNSDSLKSHRRFWLGMLAGFGAAAIVGIIVWLSIWSLSLKKEIEEVRQSSDTITLNTEITEDVAEATENETATEAISMTDAEAIEQQEALKLEEQKRIEQEKLEQEKKEREIREAKEKEEAAKTKPSDQPTYEVITANYPLGKMARKHYGTYHFWPYIYEANPNLGHPDRIRPGTRIKIPALSTLGVDPHNPADIRKAKQKDAAIYSKYR